MKTNPKRFDRLKYLNFLVIFLLVISVFTIPVTADQEPNDSFAEAEEITEGTYEGSVNETDENDYYKIELEPSTKITITFTSYAEDDQELKFYNPSQEEKFSLYSNGEIEESDEYYLSYETELDYWYIRINEYWSGGGEYTFTVELELQDDAGSGHDVAESYGDAYEIGTGTDVNGFLGDLDETDMYKVELESSSKVTVSFTSVAEMEQELKLYNPNKEQIFSLYSSGEIEESDEYYLSYETGVDYWFVEVNRYWSGSAGYQFRVDVELQNDAGSGHDVAESYGDAYEVGTGTEVSGFLGDLDETDMYKIEFEPSSIVTVSFTSIAEMEQELKFFDPNKEQIFTLYSSGEIEETGEYYLANETEVDYWFVQVNRYWSDYGNYQFTVSVDYQNDAGTGEDVASDDSEAYDIESDTTYEGFLKDLDQTDMYKIELDPSSIVTISFISYAENDQELKLYNSNNEKIFTLYSSQGVEETDVYHLANETELDYWYVEVNLYWSEGDYQFTVNVDHQDDAGSGEDVASEYSEAYEIESDTTYEGYLMDLDEQDTYKIHLTPNSIITINLTADFEDDEVFLSFINPNKEEQFTIYSSDGTKETESLNIGDEFETGYWFVMIGSSWGDGGSYSFETHVVTTGGPSPVVVSESSKTDTSITISWTENTDPDFFRYEIYVSATEGDIGYRFGFINDQSETTYTLISLDTETTYYITVRVINTVEQTADSNQIEVTTETGAQAPTPVVVSLVSKTSTSIEISWTENMDEDFDSYEIYVSGLEGASGFWEDTIDDRSTTSYTITDLDPDSTYYVMIRVMNTANKYADSNQLEVKTRAGGVPPSPVTVTVEDETKNSIEISWTECGHSDFDRYEIYMSHNEGDMGNLIEAITSRGTTSYEITGLDPETVCCFTVKVVTEDGQSANSEQVTAETLEKSEEKGGTPGFTLMVLLISISLVAVYTYKRKKR